MSRLIHVGPNRLKKKLLSKVINEVTDKFTEKYPEVPTGYFQHIPLEDISSELQDQIKKALKQDVQEYAFNCLTTFETRGPLVKLSGLGDIKFVRQAPYNEAFEDPTWEYEANSLHNMGSSITTIWHLNTVKKKGELEFYFQELRIRPEEGEIITFPSYYTHAHKFIPTNEEKLFLITTFYLGG